MTAPVLPAPAPAILLKLAHDDAAIMLETMREQMRAAEDARSRHRNGNRLMVLAVAFMINVFWPSLMLRVVHYPVGAVWTPAISSGCDMLVTCYALMRRY